MSQLRLVTFSELQPQFGVPYTRDHIRRLVRSGDFPAPCLKLSSRLNAWKEADVAAWVASKLIPKSPRSKNAVAA